MQRELDAALDLLQPENRMVCRVMLDTGLRVGDAVALKTADLAKGRQFWVKEAKTGKSRRVNLAEPLRAALLAQSGMEWVFEHRTDWTKHRTRQAVWKDIKKAAGRLGLDVNMTPHSMRKVYAVRLFERHGDLERVRRALNHDSIEVTMLYAMADKLRH